MNNEETPQQAPEHEELDELKAMLERHGQTLLVGLCIVLVVAIGINFYGYRQGKKADEAALQLAAANSVGALQSWLDRFSSSEAAPVVMLRLASAQFTSGDYSRALEFYESFLDEHAGHALAPVAQLGRAHAIEAMGQLDSARQAFESFQTAHPNHFLYPEAVLGVARCLDQLGALDKARAVYEDFIAANPSSEYTARAEQMLKRVGQTIQAPRLPAPTAMPSLGVPQSAPPMADAPVLQIPAVVDTPPAIATDDATTETPAPTVEQQDDTPSPATDPAPALEAEPSAVSTTAQPASE